MRLRYALAALAALLFALPATAQDYGVVTQDELDANTGGTDTEPRCIIALDGSFLLYDSASGNIVISDASDPGTLISKADIDALAGFAAGSEVDRCHAAEFDGDSESFFALGNGTDEVIIKFDGDGDTASRLVAPAQAAGTYALAASAGRLYLGRVQFRGAPEDGIYSVSTDGTDLTPTVVVQNADLDLLDLDVAADGSLYGVSSEFGGGDYKNVVIRVADPAGSAPALSVAFSPCGGSVPGFAACDDGGIEEFQIAEINGRELALVSNNQFSADVVVGAFTLDGTFVRTVFSGNALLADSDIEETSFSVAFDNYMAYDEVGDRLYIAARARTDTDAEAIYFVTNPFAVANEIDGVAAGMEIRVVNPAPGVATVRYSVGQPGLAQLVAFDLLGRQVALVASGDVSGDLQTATFDASALPSGVYVLRLTGPAGVVTRTVTVVR